MDYRIQNSDGPFFDVEIKEKHVFEPIKDISTLTEKERAVECAKMFERMGWNVSRECKVELSSGDVYMDMAITAEPGLDGYVEMVATDNLEGYIKKKNTVQAIMEEKCPYIFVITNGMVFDVYLDGKPAGTRTVLPSPESILRERRLLAYNNMLKNMQAGKKSNG